MATTALTGTAVLAVGTAPAQAHHRHSHHHWHHHHDDDSEEWSDYEVDHGAMFLAAPVENPTPAPTAAATPPPVAAPPAPAVGSLIACASNLKDGAAIVRVEFDGPVFRQANLLNSDCQTFSVPVGPYHFTTPTATNNPCGLFTTLNVLIRREGVNYKPTSPTDFGTWVEQGAQTRVSYFCG